MAARRKGSELNLRAGELVEVRSKEEILATLDENGRLDGLPFMPEMLKFCGKQFHVYKSAHKTCDNVSKSGGRQLPNAVHLSNLRCDGAAHGGCQAACLLFWKDAWVKRVPGKTAPLSGANGVQRKEPKCSEEALWKSVRPAAIPAQSSAKSKDEFYSCQTTEILNFTLPLNWWDIRQYVKDLTSRNVALVQLFQAALFRLFILVLRVGGYRALTSGYDRIQSMRGGSPFPYREGNLTSKTPSRTLNLRPGELVQVRSHAEILETLNREGKNRGLRFDPEMVKYCGKTFRVLRRVDRILDEKTGVMLHLPNECIILEDVICAGEHTAKRLFCPTASYPYWREIWLKRLGYEAQPSLQSCSHSEAGADKNSEAVVCRQHV